LRTYNAYFESESKVLGIGILVIELKRNSISYRIHNEIRKMLFKK